MNRQRCWLIPLAMIALQGCYFGNQTIDIPDEESLPGLSAAVSHSDCVVRLRNGNRVEADSAECMTDSIVIWQMGTATRLIYPLSVVYKVTTRKPGMGSLMGLVTGTACGALMGSFVANGVNGPDAHQGAVAAFGGIVLGISGAVIGHLGGGQTTYRFLQHHFPAPLPDSQATSLSSQQEDEGQYRAAGASGGSR